MVKTQYFVAGCTNVMRQRTKPSLSSPLGRSNLLGERLPLSNGPNNADLIPISNDGSGASFETLRFNPKRETTEKCPTHMLFHNTQSSRTFKFYTHYSQLLIFRRFKGKEYF
jgi:hypothetical protein